MIKDVWAGSPSDWELYGTSGPPKKRRGRKTRHRLAERDGAQCYLCLARRAVDLLTVDHVIPRARGGGENLSNKKLACRSCNVDKGDMLLENYVLTEKYARNRKYAEEQGLT